ncbi:unnamed protein product [Rhizoctonia solani]|uniref:Uncharacterized protein n=1 Tax=Rhizoctonia solani TaxID=456999 RepID=A0A8H2WH60_9AGAM|nr:unnamed protein product [Rhizoctonia solani]
MSSHRVFTVAELLSLICLNCDNPTRTALARTSQLWFEIVTPILWGNLQGAHKIFVLLPGTVIGRVKPTEPPPQDLRLSLDAVNFTRFNIYAPRVKRLIIYDPSDAKQRIETWYNWGFIHYLYQQQTLFPNLVSLVINQPTASGSSSRRQQNPPAYEQWVTAFSSEALQAIHAPLILKPGLPPHPLSVSLTAASVAVVRLARKSKSLRTLEIYPTASSAELSSMGQGAAFGGFMGSETAYQRFYSSIESLTQLSELSTTAIVFETSMFRTLANLPHLRSLSVHNFSYQLPDFHPGLVPTGSFPQLTKLSLIDIDQENLEKIWESKPLVQNLTSLTILSSYSRHITLDWARETFLPILRTCSPELTEFLCESRSPGRGAEFEINFSLGALDLKSVMEERAVDHWQSNGRALGSVCHNEGICSRRLLRYDIGLYHITLFNNSKFLLSVFDKNGGGLPGIRAWSWYYIGPKGSPLRQQPNQARGSPKCDRDNDTLLPTHGMFSEGRVHVLSPSPETGASLHLYYTTVKALALPSISRPALPVEIIIHICQLIGFIDPWPNRSVYTEVAFDRGATDTSTASDSSNEIRPWLCTPPLSPSLLKKVWKAEPCIHPAEPVMSRTHAFRPDELVIRIARGSSTYNYKADSEGKQLTWRYLTTRIAHEPVYPLRIFDHRHEIWEWLEPEDRIEIAVDAAGWYFPNIRSEWGVSLRVYTLWEPSETMLRLIYKCDK